MPGEIGPGGWLHRASQRVEKRRDSRRQRHLQPPKRLQGHDPPRAWQHVDAVDGQRPARHRVQAGTPHLSEPPRRPVSLIWPVRQAPGFTARRGRRARMPPAPFRLLQEEAPQVHAKARWPGRGRLPGPRRIHGPAPWACAPALQPRPGPRTRRRHRANRPECRHFPGQHSTQPRTCRARSQGRAGARPLFPPGGRVSSLHHALRLNLPGAHGDGAHSLGPAGQGPVTSPNRPPLLPARQPLPRMPGVRRQSRGPARAGHGRGGAPGSNPRRLPRVQAPRRQQGGATHP